MFYSDSDRTELVSFDYSEQDSLFNSAENVNPIAEPITNDSVKNSEKMVDSEQELLDFSKDKISVRGKNNAALAPSSINLNTANLQDLTQLPGIGIKTAGKIIEFRKINGNFTAIEQIMQVNGIGEKKFLKIKKYIVIAN